MAEDTPKAVEGPKVELSVHGVSMSQVPIPVNHEGQMMNARVDCLEVELVGTNGRNGSIVLKFIGDEIPKVQAFLKSGSKLTLPVTISAPAAAPA